MWGSADEGNITQQVADKFNASQVISKERMARIVRIIDFISKNC